jgi:hypothetical protein
MRGEVDRTQRDSDQVDTAQEQTQGAKLDATRSW